MKAALEALDTIGYVDVTRSDVNAVGGASWTISFLEDKFGTHRGNVPTLDVESFLSGGSGSAPGIVVEETRRGTVKEVQTVSIIAGGTTVNSLSSFKFKFGEEITNDILALPVGGTTCLGSTRAKQIISTSTEDTTGEGGDNTVSPLTTFVLTYEGHTTSPIKANSGTCADKAMIIADELMLLHPLNKVLVSGENSGVGDEGCVWVVSFLSVTGNPELLQGIVCLKLFAFFTYASQHNMIMLIPLFYVLLFVFF